MTTTDDVRGAPGGRPPSNGYGDLPQRTAAALMVGVEQVNPEELFRIFTENLLLGTGVQVIFGDEILRRLAAVAPPSPAGAPPQREAILAANTMMFALAAAEEKGLVLPPAVKAAQGLLVDKLWAEANARAARPPEAGLTPERKE